MEAGICQLICAALLVVISLVTTSRPEAEIAGLLWKPKYLWLPADEPKRPFFQSVPLWWTMFALFYAVVIFYLW